MPYDPRVIGVVGATGFIGQALVKAWASQGRRLRLFGRGPASVAGIEVEPLDQTPRGFAGVDCVVHLAALTTSRAGETDLRRVNIDLAVETARAAAAAKVKRFIFVSSLHVHGKSASAPIGPGSALTPDNAYGASKAAAEQELKRVAAETGLELVILRPPMVYGPGAKGSFAQLVGLVRKGWPLPFGIAKGRRSFCSIDNLISSIDHLMRVPAPPMVFLPADPDDFDTPGLVRAIADGLGTKARLWPVPKVLLAAPLALIGRGEIAASLFDTLQVDRAHWTEISWRPVQSGPEGVHRAVTGR